MDTDQLTGINSEVHDTNQKLICEQYKDGIENSQQLADLKKGGKIIVIGAGPDRNELAKAAAATTTVAIVGKDANVEAVNLPTPDELRDIELKAEVEDLLYKRKFNSLVTKPIVVYSDAPKCQRNEPCRCGSGKKYKNCCMAEHKDGKRYHYYNNK